MKRLIRFLQQPYPDDDGMDAIVRGAIIGGLVVFLILFLLQPFGLERIRHGLWKYCLQFAGITSAISLGYDLTLKYILRIRRDHPDWTLWKWMIAVSVLILLIAFGNYIYIIMIFGGELTARQFLWALYTTVLVGIFPVSLFGTANMVRLIRENQAIAGNIHPAMHRPEHHHIVDLPVKQSATTFRVDASTILYVEAMQNYVNVVYRHQDGIASELIRNTITAIEDALTATPVQRCHRSFLVNRDHIMSVSGNAQGLKLELAGLDDFEVPVSRRYIPHFRD